jgi:hypothetical protein
MIARLKTFETSSTEAPLMILGYGATKVIGVGSYQSVDFESPSAARKSMPITHANMPIRMAAFSTEDAPRVRDGAALAREKARSSKWDISASQWLRLGNGPLHKRLPASSLGSFLFVRSP